MTETAHDTISIGDYDDVNVEFTYYIANDSIGWYEFWGAREFDRQPDYLVIESIVVDDPNLTPAEVEEVTSFINQDFEKYAEKLIERYENERDYPEI